MNREDVLTILRKDVAKARALADSASAHFDTVIKESPSGLPHPDGSLRIRNASIEYSATQTRLRYAIKRLHAFMMDGTVPEDLNGSD